MYSVITKKGYLLAVVLCCLAISSPAAAAQMDESLGEMAGEVPPGVTSQTEGEIELLVEEGRSYKPFVWGDDATICTGALQGGISVAYDSNFTQYAVRCTTYNSVERAQLKVYKSTDYGATWTLWKGFHAAGSYQYTLPQVLVCEYDPDKYLYLLYHRTDSEGNIRLARYTLDGSDVDWYTVADRPSGDSITYFSACTNIYGWSLVLAYEVHESGDATPDIRTVRSIDRGATWTNDAVIDADGQHPDIAYGYDSYTYLVYGTTSGGDYEIEFRLSTNRGVSWGTSTRLISDTFDDDYPKVAALHTTPANQARVWVTFNHDYANLGNLDVRYVYSTNAGASWSSYINLANSSEYDEMAADLICWRYAEYPIVHVSYVKYRMTSMIPPIWTSNIYSAWSDNADPTNWRELTQINDHRSSYTEDAREVCQGSIMPCFLFALAGYVYTGSTKAPASFNNLYWDGYCFTDVEDDGKPGERPGEFSLYDNYPNPFNPETKISYSLARPCRVRLEIFNLLGQKIRTLVDQQQAAGVRQVVWDGRNQSGEEVASGVYFYRLEADDFSQTKKMILVR